MVFVNLSKTFDTVNRWLLWDMLARYGCPDKFVNIWFQFHDEMKSHIVMRGKSLPPLKLEYKLSRVVLSHPFSTIQDMRESM